MSMQFMCLSADSSLKMLKAKSKHVGAYNVFI
jgi:hypothetical protein